MKNNKLFIMFTPCLWIGIGLILLVITLLCPAIENAAGAETEKTKLGELDKALVRLDEAFYDAQMAHQDVMAKAKEVAELQEGFKPPSPVTTEKKPAAPAIKEKPAKEEPAAEEEPELPEYIIGKGDVLYVYVWDEEGLSHEVMVRPDGRISYPLAGEIHVAGLTLSEMKRQITERLSVYIKYPVVSISVRSMAGQKVIILGEVEYTGAIYVSGNETILEVIAEAGGFTEDAVVSSVIVIRGGFGSDNPVGMRLNLTRAIDDLDMSQNIRLRSGDIIYIPKKFIANVNYFIEQVLGPLSGTKTIVDDLRGLRHPTGTE